MSLSKFMIKTILPLKTCEEERCFSNFLGTSWAKIFEDYLCRPPLLMNYSDSLSIVYPLHHFRKKVSKILIQSSCSWAWKPLMLLVSGRITSNLFSSALSLQRSPASYCIFVTAFLTQSPRTLLRYPYALVSCHRSHILSYNTVKIILQGWKKKITLLLNKCLTSQAARMLFCFTPILITCFLFWL